LRFFVNFQFFRKIFFLDHSCHLVSNFPHLSSPPSTKDHLESAFWLSSNIVSCSQSLFKI
jgi:hypothetical protein